MNDDGRMERLVSRVGACCVVALVTLLAVQVAILVVADYRAGVLIGGR